MIDIGSLLYILTMIVIYTLIGATLEHYKIKFLHESGIAILIGIITTFIMKFNNIE